MAYRCIFLLFYFVLTTYQRASAVNSDRILFVEQEKDIFTRKPSLIDFSNSNSVDDNFSNVIGRHRRDINAISRSDNNLPRNISVQVSFDPCLLDGVFWPSLGCGELWWNSISFFLFFSFLLFLCLSSASSWAAVRLGTAILCGAVHHGTPRYGNELLLGCLVRCCSSSSQLKMSAASLPLEEELAVAAGGGGGDGSGTARADTKQVRWREATFGGKNSSIVVATLRAIHIHTSTGLLTPQMIAHFPLCVCRF